MYYLDLTAAEMNGDTVAVIVKTSTSGAKTTPIVLYPAEDADIPVNVEAWDGSAVGALNDPSTAAIADQVWDEAQADHTTVGSTGASLNNAGSGASAADIADAVLDEALADHVGAGSLSKAVSDILADTGTDGVVVAAASKTGYALTTAEHTNIADALLKRDWTSVTGEAARSVLNALRFLRNKVSIASSTMTVTKEDDSTEAWTAAVTTDAAADPVTAVDPT
jgi:hypothetical protein